jgi:hypothetical protein
MDPKGRALGRRILELGSCPGRVPRQIDPNISNVMATFPRPLNSLSISDSNQTREIPRERAIELKWFKEITIG